MTTRVLMSADAVGGVWQYATELAGGLRDHGYETVIALLGPPADPEELRRARSLPGVRIVETGLPLDWLSDAASVNAASRQLAELARREGADLVHLNSPALAADQSFGVPTVGVAHGCLSTWWEAARGEPLAPDFAWHRELMKRGLRACDRVLAPSASFAETVQRHYGLPVCPGVVHNGRSVPPAGPAVQMQDYAFTAGRLWDEVKNARTLDAAAARLPFPFKAAGPCTAPHGETAAFEHLHALGHVDGDTLARLLAPRPVFVSAARFEPFGLAVLEAAGAGCALVLADIRTFRELWSDAAVFVDPDDDVGFALAIDDLIGDTAARVALGEAARHRAQLYSAERMTAAMAGQYRDLLARRAAA